MFFMLKEFHARRYKYYTYKAFFQCRSTVCCYRFFTLNDFHCEQWSSAAGAVFGTFFLYQACQGCFNDKKAMKILIND